MECRRIYDREWRAKNPKRHAEIQWKRHLKHAYGLTPEQYAEMLADQNYLCLICNISLHDDDVTDSRFAVVDHDHSTAKVRGIICNKCNSGLGMLGDDLDTIRAALAYLERYA